MGWRWRGVIKYTYGHMTLYYIPPLRTHLTEDVQRDFSVAFVCLLNCFLCRVRAFSTACHRQVSQGLKEDLRGTITTTRTYMHGYLVSCQACARPQCMSGAVESTGEFHSPKVSGKANAIARSVITSLTTIKFVRAHYKYSILQWRVGIPA